MIILAKFSKLEYLKDIQKGKIFMNSLNYFRTLEQKGQGDSMDTSIPISPNNFKIEVNGNFVNIKGITKLNYKIDNDYPIFCVSIMEIVNGKFVNKEYLKRFKEDFSPYFMIFKNEKYQENFLKQIENYCKNSGYGYQFGIVKYYDFSDKNYPWEKEINITKGLNIAFIKDIAYEQQKEFRVVLGKDLKEEHKNYFIMDLGYDFTNETIIYEIKDDGELEIVK